MQTSGILYFDIVNIYILWIIRKFDMDSLAFKWVR